MDGANSPVDPPLQADKQDVGQQLEKLLHGNRDNPTHPKTSLSSIRIQEYSGSRSVQEIAEGGASSAKLVSAGRL